MVTYSPLDPMSCVCCRMKGVESAGWPLKVQPKLVGGGYPWKSHESTLSFPTVTFWTAEMGGFTATEISVE